MFTRYVLFQLLIQHLIPNPATCCTLSLRHELLDSGSTSVVNFVLRHTVHTVNVSGLCTRSESRSS